MTILSKSHLSALAVAAAAVGCNLDDDGPKNSCNLASDCLAGYQCIDNVCVGGNMNGGVDAPLGPYYGTVEPMASQSAGLAGANYRALLAATTAGGTLGCAVVGDLQASPGPGTAVVYAKVPAESSDIRCPDGTFAIMNDPQQCNQLFAGDLNPHCAVYKRWDATGKQVANQLATGGYVHIQGTYINNSSQRCDAELSIQFAGGVTIAKSFSFTYDPLGPTSKFCTH